MAKNSIGMKLFVGLVKAIGNVSKGNQGRKTSIKKNSQRATKECPNCHYFFKSAKCPYCADRLLSHNYMEERVSNVVGVSAKATNFLPPIPQGYQIYQRMLLVAGISFRKDDASRFIRGTSQSLEFESEPSNPKDKNAIKVIGVTSSSRYFVGYIPKDIANALVKTGLLNKIQLRLDRTYHGIKDFVEIRFQIIGLKEDKKQFDAYFKNKPATAGQKIFFKYFGLPIHKGLTADQANQIIGEHRAKLDAQDTSLLKEYGAYIDILVDFDDSEFRKEYEVKKPSNDFLNDVLDRLKREGNTYADLSVDIQVVVDLIVKLKPELARA